MMVNVDKPTFENAGLVCLKLISTTLVQIAMRSCFVQPGRIREERKFEKLEDLISQVHADADQAKEILKALETPLQVS